MGRWDVLPMGGPDSQTVTQLVECGAETTGRLKVPEAKHRVVALLDRTMTLLHAVVQVLILAVQDLATDDPANCLRAGRRPVSGQAQWLLACTIQ